MSNTPMTGSLTGARWMHFCRYRFSGWRMTTAAPLMEKIDDVKSLSISKRPKEAELQGLTKEEQPIKVAPVLMGFIAAPPLPARPSPGLSPLTGHGTWPPHCHSDWPPHCPLQRPWGHKGGNGPSGCRDPTGTQRPAADSSCSFPLWKRLLKNKTANVA